MPYPESCPECGSQFRNTGTHFTARRNEVGRHVLLELGCQNTNRRYWWDFTAGQLADDGKAAAPVLVAAVVGDSNGSNGAHRGPSARDSVSSHREPSSSGSISAHREEAASGSFAGHREPAKSDSVGAHREPPAGGSVGSHQGSAASTDSRPAAVANNGLVPVSALDSAQATTPESTSAAVIRMTSPEHSMPTLVDVAAGPKSDQPTALKDAFVRQLQLDRMTLRQMRSLLMSDDARRAIEVAVGATEATYERLALILFGTDLPQLLGKAAIAPTAPTMSAEERLELQREKARIRARLRRAAIKAAKQAPG
jgi:hypothetical protein